MALVMLANDGPDALVGLAVGFGVFVVVFACLTLGLYRPLFANPGEGNV